MHIVTIEAAKSKMCPFVDKYDQCIANKCMAWVETKSHYELDDLTQEEKSQRLAPDRYFNMPINEYEGYCTLVKGN